MNSTNYWLGSIAVGMVVLLCTVIFVSLDMNLTSKAAILAIVWALLVGLAIWWRAEYVRNRPLPGRWRSLDARCAEVFHFSQAELALNRSGRMSISQCLRTLSGDLAWWVAALVCIGGPTALLIHSFADLSGKAVIVALFVIGAGAWAFYRAAFACADGLRGRVSCQTTHLRPVSKQGNWLTSVSFYSLHTDAGAELRVPHSAFGALDEGATYGVYFAPLSKQLISAEAVHGNPKSHRE